MNSNGIINSCTCAIPDYTPQIIGIVGTLLGTFLGWLLKYLQDTLGKTKLIIESFVDYKDESQHYAYNLKLFICNNALNPKYIRDFKVTFYKGDNKIFEKTPKCSENGISFVNIKNQKEFDILYLCYNQPQTIVLCDLILNSEYEKLCNVDKIVLTYKDTKNKEKRLIIDDDFLISEVNQYDAGKIIPT